MNMTFSFRATLLSCSFLIPVLVFSQSAVVSHTDSIRHWLMQADKLYETDQFKPSARLAEAALQQAENLSAPANTELKSAAIFATGRAYARMEEYESADLLLHQSLELYQLQYPEGSAAEAFCWLELGDNLQHWGKYTEALLAAQQAQTLLNRFFPENHPNIALGLALTGNILKEQGVYGASVTNLEAALNIVLPVYGEQSRRYSIVLRGLGETYVYAGNLDLGISTLEKALAIQQKVLPRLHHETGRTCMALGLAQRTMGEYENAILYYQEAQKAFLTRGTELHHSIAYCYSETAQAQIGLLQYEAALESVKKEMDIMHAVKRDTHPDFGYTCHDLAKVYLSLKRYPESIEWQKKSIELLTKAAPEGSTDIASLYLWLARAQLANRAFPDAIQSFAADHRILSHIFGDDCSNLHYAEFGFATTYLNWYRQTRQEALLDSSRMYFQYAQNHLFKNLEIENHPRMRRRLLSDAVALYDQAITAELRYQQNHPDAAGLENAWRFSESLRGYLFRASTQAANARHYAGLPDDLLAQDSTLRADITILSKKRQIALESEGHTLTDSLVLDLSNQLTQKRTAAKKLEKLFENNYPEYYRLKYDLKTVSLAQTQQKIGPDQTLLEYFTGDSSIFVFIVKQNTARVAQLPRNFPLNEWISEFRSGITRHHTADKSSQPPDDYEKSVLQYAASAEKLYQKLLKPFESELTRELIIIPGEELANLPFEALLQTTPKDLSNFNTFPFLVKNFEVHYAFSGTSLVQMTEKKHLKSPGKMLLAMAPFYLADTLLLAENRSVENRHLSAFQHLPFSGEEVLRAQSHAGSNSNVWLGKQASKTLFSDEAGKYRILHLATHGKANNKAGDYSFLALAPPPGGTAEDGLLDAGELYNFNLNADLVLLSACETGIGEVQRGEGVASLARAFAFAGAKSIIASLWHVSDRSTMQIIDAFYLGLTKGKSKNQALAAAKRQYLSNNPGRMSHPFFWAGLTATGDMAPVKMK